LEVRTLHPWLLPHGSADGKDGDDDGQAGAAVCHTAYAPDTPLVLRTSLYWFGEYIWAVTGGRLSTHVDVHWVDPDRITAAVEVKGNQATPPGEQIVGDAFSALPSSFVAGADCWACLHPSGVPTHESFGRSGFITGGMGGSPDGRPLFMVDDLWLVRKPPNLGAGIYSPVERLAYLPQWWQHEWYHALFNHATLFSECNLEPTSHSWFQRDAWPPDFEGVMEVDYHDQALHKRFLDPTAHPPLWYRLKRWAWTPDAAPLLPQAVLGSWRHQNASNDWHYVTIEPGPGGVLQWRNRAGVSWSLAVDAEGGRLLTGDDCPYKGIHVQIIVGGPPLEGVGLDARIRPGAAVTIVGLDFGGLYMRAA
jgi:hypothetical protein